ncbi:MAG: ABC transporter permease [Terriglobales bacterium]
MTVWIGEFRQAFRQWRRAPGFAIAVVAILALAIGANTAIFSVVDAVLLRPLSYQDPSRLVLVQERIPEVSGGIAGGWRVSAPDIALLRRDNRVFTAVASVTGDDWDLAGSGFPPQRISGFRASYNLFSVLGVQPVLGRVFTRQEDLGAQHVVLLSYGLWQQRFAGDRAVLGRSIRLDDRPYTIVGVLPAGLDLPEAPYAGESPVGVWVPMSFTKDELGDIGDNFEYTVIGRLKPGVTMAQANANLLAVAANIQKTTYPSAAQLGQTMTLQMLGTPLKDLIVGKVRAQLWLLLGAVGLVLLIACANVANLLLSRLAARGHELAIRAALGAGRGALIRHALIESCTLALAGGALGLVVAAWGARALVALAPATLQRAAAIALDGPVLAFTVAVALLTGVAFGLAPALAGTRAALPARLQEAGRASSFGRRHARLRATLIVAEVALSLVLLAGAGLLLRSFANVVQVAPGFSLEDLTFALDPPQARYPQPAQVDTFYDELAQRLRALPGVTFVAAASSAPMDTGWNRIFVIEHRPAHGMPLLWHNLVAGDYFQAVGIPLIRGRFFNDGDRAKTTPVVIINQAMAQRYFRGQNPIGQRVAWGAEKEHGHWETIVGVVGNVRERSLDQAISPHAYAPFSQQQGGWRSRTIILRAAGDPAALAGAARAIVHQLDPDLALANVTTTRRIVATSLAPRRFNTGLLALFALAALLLAAAGVYAVISYSVTQQTREIGVRVALGARPADVIRMVLRDGARLLLFGAAAGFVGSFFLLRALQGELYGLSPADPWSFLLALLVLAAAALAACWLPARRAARVDPVVALRYE